MALVLTCPLCEGTNIREDWDGSVDIGGINDYITRRY